MPLTGGAADKAGNSYERRLTVRALLDVLESRAESIRVEVPGEAGAGAEFELVVNGVSAWYQAKRQRDAGPWTIAALAGEDVFGSWWPKLRAGGRIVFASSTGAQELKELAERAIDAESWPELQAEFLTGVQRARFQRLKAAWGDPPDEAVYEALQGIEVMLVDDARLDEIVDARLASLVIGNPMAAAAVLGRLVEDSVHQRLTADDVRQALEQNQIGLQNLSGDTAVSARLRQTVERYVARLRRLYIGGRELTRPEGRDAFTHLADGRRVLIAGAAGMGKSVVVGQVAEMARQDGWTVLVLSADRLPDADTAEDLGAALGLPGSPPVVLAGAAGGGDCLFVVDQLDAVSAASGRHAERMAVIGDLLVDAAAFPNLHVVLACRQFDLDNDRELRALATEDDMTVIPVGPLEQSTVLGVLADVGLPTSLPAGLRDLLTVPQHLAIYVNLAPTPEPGLAGVRTLTDLYERYWRDKHQACSASRGGPDEWVEVIDRLVSYMSDHQGFTAPAAIVDDLAEQVSVMASENVLMVEDGVVSFFHETFFDHAYARRFVARGRTIRELLGAGEQDLFRRAQVRQILTYERAIAFDQYICDLRWILGSDEVRTHLKALTIASMETIRGPRPAEWDSLALIAAGPDHPLHARLWRAIRRNPDWFVVLLDAGAWSAWLSSPDPDVVDRALWLLSNMTREHGDEITDLLSSLLRDDRWPGRLRGFVFRADVSASRQLFEVILEAIADGLFDGDHRDDLWYTTRSLVDRRPEYAVDAIAALFHRAFAGGVDNPFEGSGPLATGRDAMAGQAMRAAAHAAPQAFVEQLLSSLLEVASRCADVYPQRDEVVRDSVWGYRIYGSRTSLADDFFDAMVDALRALAKSDPDVANTAFERLRNDPHEATWFLLACGYAANPDRFGDAAVTWLAETPGALHLGYGDAEHWVSRELVVAISPTCGQEQLDQLTDAIIGYTPPYERTYDGLPSRGYGELCLLNGVDPTRRSDRVERRLAELRRKFHSDDVRAPRGFRGGVVPPPIPADRARKMFDRHWLGAMERHGESGPRFDRGGDFVGDAWTQAQVLEELTRESPDRFARLLLRIPGSVSKVYPAAILQGLKGADLDTALLLEVCQHARSIGDALDRYIADLVLSRAATTLPGGLLDMTIDIATKPPDTTDAADLPLAEGDDDASARGAAALAIGQLVGQHHDRLARFYEALERLATDESASVREMTVAAATTILYVDAEVALDLFHKTLGNDQGGLQASPYVERFLNHAIRRDHYLEIADVLKQMLASDVQKTRLAAVRQLTVAAYQFPELDDQLDRAVADDEAPRAAMIKVVADNVTNPTRRGRAFELLSRALNDPAPKVRSAAVTCLYGLDKEPITGYVPLLDALLSTPALDEAADTILHMLNQARQPLPPVVLDLCEQITDRHGPALGDITTASAAAGRYLAQLSIRLHAQHTETEIRRRCLDLIDRLVTAGVDGIDDDLAEIER